MLIGFAPVEDGPSVEEADSNEHICSCMWSTNYVADIAQYVFVVGRVDEVQAEPLPIQGDANATNSAFHSELVTGEQHYVP
jgi:hypothetical protein